MHEIGIAEGIVGISCDEAARAGMRRVTVVKVAIGKLRQVVPDALRCAFDAVKAGTVAHLAQLEIREIQVEAQCHGCGRRFEVDDAIFVCPYCGDHRHTLHAGDQLQVESMEGE